MRIPIRTLASFLITGALIGCDGNDSSAHKDNLQHREIKLASGYVVRGDSEEINYGDGARVGITKTMGFGVFGGRTIGLEGNVTLVHVNHGNSVCVKGDKFVYWSDSKGRVYDHQHSDYFGHSYAAWDPDGYKEFVGRKDLKGSPTVEWLRRHESAFTKPAKN